MDAMDTDRRVEYVDEIESRQPGQGPARCEFCGEIIGAEESLERRACWLIVHRLLRMTDSNPVNLWIALRRAQGHSFGQIAAELSLSKNAVYERSCRHGLDTILPKASQENARYCDTPSPGGSFGEGSR